MVLLNTKKVRILALFVAMLSIGAISSSNANAASTFGTYTDNDGVVWDAETNDDGDIYIGIHSVPSSLTTVTVPSLSDVASGKTTYFLDAVCSRKATPDCSSVIADTANVTKLDMTNTSGIQIKNVSQMFNTSHEVELKFGANVVIADPDGVSIVITNIEADSYQERENSYGTVFVDGTAISPLANPYEGVVGAFEGMKVKLTDLSNVKYIGWNAFKDTTLNAASKDITINNNQTIGGYIFAGSNVESASVDTAEIGQGFCKGCTSLASITIGNNVTTLYGSAFEGTTALNQEFNSKNITEIYGRAFKGSAITGVSFGDALNVIDYEAFMDTNLGDVALGNNVTTVKTSAFRNAGITSIDLKNVEQLSSWAFLANSIEEVYLPKSINNLNGDYYHYRYVSDPSETYEGNAGAAGIFADNNLKKLTIAYDMYTNHTISAYAPKIGCGMPYTGGPATPQSYTCTSDPVYTLEEIILVAPYGENDTVSSDRVSSGSYYAGDQQLLAASKNIVSAEAFYDFQNLKKITIGEGYEYVMQSAFYQRGPYDQAHGSFEELNLPSTLRAADMYAFAGLIHGGNTTIEEMPESLEFVGDGAFMGDYGLTINKFDSPNLRVIEQGAFMTVTIKELALHDKMEQLGASALFANMGGFDKITIDFDIFGTADYAGYNPTGLKNAIGWQVNSDLRNWSSAYSYAYVGFEIDESWKHEAPYGTFYYPLRNASEDGDGEYTRHYSAYHLGEVIFTEKAVHMPEYKEFNSIYADKLDLSATPWTELYIEASGHNAGFYGAEIGELVLPLGLERIGENAFYSARVSEPVVLPNTLEVIGDRAFMSNAVSGTGLGVNVANIPSSLEEIGHAAFLNDELMTSDVDLSNLTSIGYAAFQGSNVRDVILGNSITSLGANAFYNTPNLRNVTIDLDLYNVTHNYGDEILNQGTQHEYTKINYCYKRSGEKCLSTTSAAATYAEDMAERDANFYDSFVATFGDQNHKYGTITFTENAGEPCGGFMNCTIDRTDYTNPANRPYFYGLKAAKVDLSATNWETTSESMFQESEIDELILPSGLQNFARDTFYNTKLGDVSVPTTLVAIQDEAFQWATANIDGLPEGLLYIGPSAFYGADVTDNLVIPGTVGQIGQSAFNAGDADVHYDTITIKPSLSASQTNGQLIFQLFWNVDVDKMIIASMGLPAGVVVPEGQTMPEFYGMPMDEVVITNLSAITKEAFQDCTNLKKVDMSSDANLRAIYNKAFINASKLDTIMFSPAIKDQIVIVGSLAFKGTAFKTMGDSTKQFDLTAAKFDASAGSAFAEMPKLETVDVPRSFSNATVPESTFMNDGELRVATIDYKVTLIDDGAFSEDNKLESIFIWGNTEIVDSTLAGHGASTDGENGIYANPTDQGRGADRGPTIPEGTDIYAYSTSPAEDYAALPVRTTFEGEFYPLDEVLYLTSNKPTVLLNDDETDFDKSDLVVYAMRRDGIILESDEWGVYTGKAYARGTSDVDFESMAEAIQDDPVFGSIHDTPVPMDELDVTTNVNFENIDFALVPTEENPNVKKVTILYNDKYTDHLADTDIVPYSEDEPTPAPIVPDTGAKKAMKAFMNTGLPIVVIAMVSVLGSVLVYKKRKN